MFGRVKRDDSFRTCDQSKQFNQRAAHSRNGTLVAEVKYRHIAIVLPTPVRTIDYNPLDPSSPIPIGSVGQLTVLTATKI